MKKRIIIPIAALILLCGILTGIGILLSSQKPEKTSEKKTEKVEQELQTKPEETPGNPKQEQEKAASAKESEEQEEEPLSMDLSGLNEEALSMMGISKKEVGHRNMDFPVPQGHSFWNPCWYDFRKENTAWIASSSLQMVEMEFSRRMHKPN